VFGREVIELDIPVVIPVVHDKVLALVSVLAMLVLSHDNGPVLIWMAA
jgi:hypothetical protein